MKKQLLVIHGPNINLTGIREPGVYGSESLEQINEEIRACREKEGFGCEICQSNHEGQIIDWSARGHGARGWDYFKCRRLHALQLRHPRCDCCNKNSLYRGAFFQYPGKKRFSASFGYCAGLRRVNCGLWKTQLPARSRCFQKNPCIIFAKSLAKDWNII